jgi:hypothetical protein
MCRGVTELSVIKLHNLISAGMWKLVDNSGFAGNMFLKKPPSVLFHNAFNIVPRQIFG